MILFYFIRSLLLKIWIYPRLNSYLRVKNGLERPQKSKCDARRVQIGFWETKENGVPGKKNKGNINFSSARCRFYICFYLFPPSWVFPGSGNISLLRNHIIQNRPEEFLLILQRHPIKIQITPLKISAARGKTPKNKKKFKFGAK